MKLRCRSSLAPTAGVKLLTSRPALFRRVSRITATVCLYCGAFMVAAAAAEDDRSDPQWGGVPPVLTPSRLPQRLDESPSTVTVIDRAMIEASGARRLVDLLRLVPGFQVGYKINSLPTAAYHGLNDEYARRTLLLLNGQRVFQYARGVIEWNNLPIPLENIERIEVVRGPAAAAYGSNALQAVINIQTGGAAEYPGFSGRVTAGTDGIADGFIRHGGRLGSFDYTVALSGSGDGGYQDLYDSRRNTVLSFMGELPFSGGGELQVQAGYARGDYGIEDPEPSLLSQPRDFPVTNNFQTLRWRQLQGDGAEWVATLSHNIFYYGDQGFTNNRVLPGVNLDFNYEIDEERYEATLQHLRQLSDRARGVLDLGYYHETVNSPRYFDTAKDLDNAVAWLGGHVEYRLNPRFVLNAGAMLEHSSLTQSWQFLPRLSAHYHLDDRQTLRFSYSTGSRQPTLYENNGRAILRATNVPIKIYGVVASGDLDPEINRSLEVGYHWGAERDHVDIRLFYDRYSDYIGTHYRPAPGLLTILPGVVLDFANEEPLTVRGLEAQWDWRGPSGTRVFAGYALTDIDASGARYDAGYADSAPRHGLGFLVSQPFGNGWQASLIYDFQSKMRWYRDKPIRAYHQLGARVSKQFNLGATPVTAELVGTNLLGPVEDYLPDQSWDRAVYFRLNVDY